MNKFIIIIILLIAILSVSSCGMDVASYTPTPQPTFTTVPNTSEPTPTTTPTKVPIATPTATPTATATPTIKPTEKPTKKPTKTPTSTPKVTATPPAPTYDPNTDLTGVNEYSPTFVSTSHYMYKSKYKGKDGFHGALDVEYISSSSYLATQSGNTYKSKNLYDFDLETAWCEGGSDYGIGEWIVYYVKAQEYAPDAAITKIEIINGYIKSDDAFNNNSMAKKILVLVDDQKWCVLNLSKDKRIQQFEIPEIKLSTSDKIVLKFVILDAYEGKKYKDTCITAIEFFGTGIDW